MDRLRWPVIARNLVHAAACIGKPRGGKRSSSVDIHVVGQADPY
jgi:hypothetical protein